MKNPKFVPAKKQVAGNSILEFNLYNVLILLGAAGLLAAFVWSQTAGKVSDARDLLSQIQVGIKSEYPNGGPYTGISSATLAGNLSLPANRLSGTNIKNPLGLGHVTLAPATYPSGNTDGAYAISLPVDTGSCSKVVSGSEAQFERIVVGSATIKDRSSGTAFSKAAVDAACQAAVTVTAVFTNQ